MPFIRREVWGYSILLVILLLTAMFASRATIQSVEGMIPNPSPEDYRTIALTITSLTLGFMLIAGAFGLWGIQFAARSEAKRRVGRFVDAMDYIKDPLIAIDNKGRISGSNPAAYAFLRNSPDKTQKLTEVISSLSVDDVAALLDRHGPSEIEKDFMATDGSTRMIRLRSQPSEELTLVMITDVTTARYQRDRSRQMVRLQLIGQLARGVANDFTELLTSVSSHASLVPRLRPGSPEAVQSIDAIARSANKGLSLASHLLELSTPIAAGQSTHRLDQHVLAAADTLRTVLVPGWMVDATVAESVPPVGLTGVQVEQIVLHLGLLVTDAVSSPRTLQIIVKAGPSADGRPSPSSTSASLWIGLSTEPPPMLSVPVASHALDPGVIQSVISSMLEGSGGSIEKVLDRDGLPSYRVMLPSAGDDSMSPPSDDVPVELKQQFTTWHILMAVPRRDIAPLRHVLSDLGASVDSVDTISSALARVEEDTAIDAIIIDTFILGSESRGILRALGKLRPSAGIIVTGENAASAAGTMENVIVAEKFANATQAATFLLESRTAALHRRSSVNHGVRNATQG